VNNELTTKQRSLFGLIAELPRLLTALVKEEIEQLKRETRAKLTRAGVGIGLFAAAAIVAVFAIGALLAAAVLGLALVVPAWLAALIVAGALLVVAALLVLVGFGKLKRRASPAETGANDQSDSKKANVIGKQEKP